MVYYRKVKSTEHYREYHEHEVSWSEVIAVMYFVKNPKKKGNKFEIKTEKYYILFRVKDKTAYVINAKRK